MFGKWWGRDAGGSLEATPHVVRPADTPAIAWQETDDGLEGPRGD